MKGDFSCCVESISMVTGLTPRGIYQKSSMTYSIKKPKARLIAHLAFGFFSLYKAVKARESLQLDV